MFLFALLYFYKDASVAVVRQDNKKVLKVPKEWKSRETLEMQWGAETYSGIIILMDENKKALDDLAIKAKNDILSQLDEIPENAPEELFKLEIKRQDGKRKRNGNATTSATEEQDLPAKAKNAGKKTMKKKSDETPALKQAKRKLCTEDASLNDELTMLKELSGIGEQFSESRLPDASRTSLNSTWNLVQGKLQAPPPELITCLKYLYRPDVKCYLENFIDHFENGLCTHQSFDSCFQSPVKQAEIPQSSIYMNIGSESDNYYSTDFDVPFQMTSQQTMERPILHTLQNTNKINITAQNISPQTTHFAQQASDTQMTPHASQTTQMIPHSSQNTQMTAHTHYTQQAIDIQMTPHASQTTQMTPYTQQAHMTPQTQYMEPAIDTQMTPLTSQNTQTTSQNTQMTTQTQYIQPAVEMQMTPHTTQMTPQNIPTTSQTQYTQPAIDTQIIPQNTQMTPQTQYTSPAIDTQMTPHTSQNTQMTTQNTQMTPQTSHYTQKGNTTQTSGQNSSTQQKRRTSPRKQAQLQHAGNLVTDPERVVLLEGCSVTVERKAFKKAIKAAKERKNQGYSLALKLMPLLFETREMAFSRGQGLSSSKIKGDGMRPPLDAKRCDTLKEYVSSWCGKHGFTVPTEKDYNKAITEAVGYARKQAKKMAQPVAQLMTQPVAQPILQPVVQSKFHEHCLTDMVEDRNAPYTELDIAVLLANHLFLPLVAYDHASHEHGIIAYDSNKKIFKCPCTESCIAKIGYGYSEFGSGSLWFGRSDIMLFPVGGGLMNIIICPHSHSIGSTNFEEQFPLETCEQIVDSDVKSDMNQLRIPKNVRQATSQAITFSFLQRKFQSSNRDMCKSTTLIPTIFASRHYFDVYFYDSENDVLLINFCDPIPIFERPKWQHSKFLPKFDLDSILRLWMLINHLLLHPRLPNEMKKLSGSCGIRKQIEANNLMEKVEESIGTGCRSSTITLQDGFSRKKMKIGSP